MYAADATDAMQRAAHMCPSDCPSAVRFVACAQVGKADPKKHLENEIEELLSTNINQCLGTMLDTVVF
jgi:hypothetical protein